MTEFKLPSDAVPKPPPEPSAAEVEVETWFREFMWQATSQTKRTLQTNIGPSEIGNACDRAISYKVHGTPEVNLRGINMSATSGTALHAWMEGRLDDLFGNTGRYLSETPIEYRGVKGTCDLYDRYKRRVVDFKTTSKTRLNQLLKKRVMPAEYRVQTSIYAAGLASQGYEIDEVAIVVIVREGNDLECMTFVMDYDQQVADDAIDRLERLKDIAPEDTEATPNILCRYCPFYLPESTDLTVGCPGKK